MLHLAFLFLLVFAKLQSDDHPPKFEGVLGEPTIEISNLTNNVPYFLPYNPIIVEVGGYEGENTKNLAKAYPYGHIIVFEPNPRAFKSLILNKEGLNNISAFNLALGTYNGTAKLKLNHGIYFNNLQLERLSSLLEESPCENHPFKEPTVDVTCLILDDWCKRNGIDHIDFLQLDTEGFELQILKSSPEILKTVIVIHTKTNFYPFRKETTQYHELKEYLEQSGFEMLSHWYREGLQGEATFVQKRIYDALFR